MKKPTCHIIVSMIAFTHLTIPSVPVQETSISTEVREVQIESNIVDVKEPISIGVCKLTAYCKENYPHICNNGDSTKTATGTTPTPGRTVAVNPSKIPYGSEVIINGHTYIAEDCGGAITGNKVDILFATHQEALNFGIQYAEVFVKEQD